MSDSCSYELENNVWDEFGGCDDHLVPHSDNGCWNQCTVQSDSRKKLRHDVTGVGSNYGDVTKYGVFGEEERGLETLKDRMLEKNSLSHTTNGAFPSGNGDQCRENIACDPSPMSSCGLQNGHIDSIGTEFCAGDAGLVDKRVGEDNNVYCYPLNNISQNDDDLSFLNDERGDKESSDLLYYGWADIGNFEDVDRMFRSCDSTFGLGSLNNEDDLWFSSTHAAEGSEVALEPDAKLNGKGYYETSHPESTGFSTDDFEEKSVLISGDRIPYTTSGDNGDHRHFFSMNSVHAESKSNDGLPTIEQMNLHKKQSEWLDPSKEEKDQGLVNGSSFHHCNDAKQLTEVSCPNEDSSSLVFSSSGLQHYNRNGPDSSSYMPKDTNYKHLSYISPSDPVSMCQTQSGVSSGINGLSAFTNESSYASNQVQSMGSSNGLPFMTPTVITNEEKKGKLHHQLDMQASSDTNFQHVNIESQMTIDDPVTVQKQFNQFDQDEDHSEVEGVCMRNPKEFDSSNGQGSSSVGSLLDETSPEAKSFHQLQQIMGKLDIRTKLCIRDSLYRLAKSAEQRHNGAKVKGGNKIVQDLRGSLVDGDTNQCSSFMDIETDTNPIDRSIAHLLFHRPTDSSQMTTNNSSSLKSHVVVTSPAVMAEKQLSQENSSTAEKEMSTCDGK